MALFLLQAAYTSEAWAKQLQSPKNRAEAVRPVVKKLGGKLIHSWLSFGEYDLAAVCEMPDNVSAAAFAMAAAAGGALKSHKTTPLFTMEEGIEAMKKAALAGYRAPGS